MEHWSESILRWLDANEIDIHIKIKSIRKTGGEEARSRSRCEVSGVIPNFANGARTGTPCAPSHVYRAPKCSSYSSNIANYSFPKRRRRHDCTCQPEGFVEAPAYVPDPCELSEDVACTPEYIKDERFL